jgi:hypothetical protein
MRQRIYRRARSTRAPGGQVWLPPSALAATRTARQLPAATRRNPPVGRRRTLSRLIELCVPWGPSSDGQLPAQAGDVLPVWRLACRVGSPRALASAPRLACRGQVGVPWLPAGFPERPAAGLGASILAAMRATRVRGRNRWPWARMRVRRPGMKFIALWPKPCRPARTTSAGLAVCRQMMLVVAAWSPRLAKYPRGDRPGTQGEDADPAATGLGPQRLAEGQGEGLGRAVYRLLRAGLEGDG